MARYLGLHERLHSIGRDSWCVFYGLDADGIWGKAFENGESSSSRLKFFQSMIILLLIHCHSS